MKSILRAAGGIGALLMAVPVLLQIAGGSTLFNPLSYLLWSMLSFLATIVYIRAGKGGWAMMLGYFFSDLLVAVFSYSKTKVVIFERFELLIVCLVVLCTLIWLHAERRKNLRPSVIANAVASITAGLPIVVSIFKNPSEMSISVALGYIGVSIASYVGENEFNGRLIPALSIVYWIVILVPVISSHYG